MNPEKRRLLSKLRGMRREIGRLELLVYSHGYTWNKINAYIFAIKEKLDDAIRYLNTEE